MRSILTAGRPVIYDPTGQPIVTPTFLYSES